MSYILETLKEFYLNNCESLFKGNGRSKWLSIPILLIEHFYFFSLMLLSSYLDKQKQNDNNTKILSYISLHRVSEQFIETIIPSLFGINVVILLTLIIFYAAFCQTKYKQKKNILLSFFLMNYNSIISIPSILFSLRQSYPLGIANILLTLTLSFLCSSNSQFFYNYELKDWLSKRGNLWDILRFQIINLEIICFELFEIKLYQEFILTFSVINSLFFLNQNLYHNQDASILYLSLNVFLILISIIMITFDSFTQNSSFSLLAILLFTFSYQISRVIVCMIHDRILNIADNLLISSLDFPSKISMKKIVLIDYYSRFKISKAHTQSQEIKLFSSYFEKYSLFRKVDTSDNWNLSKIYENIHKSVQDTRHHAFSKNHNNTRLSETENIIDIDSETKQFSHPNQMSFHIGKFLEEEEYQTSLSLRNELDILTSLFSYSSNEKKYSQKGDEYLRYFFYLLEIEKNYPKLQINLLEHMQRNRTKLKLRELKILYLLLEELKKREIKLKGEKLTDLSIAFKFEKKFQSINTNLFEALKIKEKWLQELCQDCLNLLKIQKIGFELMNKRQDIAQSFIQIKQEFQENFDLDKIQNIFLNSLWMDPDDIYFTLFSFDHIPQFSRLQVMKSQKIKEFEKMSLISCTIMVSLSHSQFGNILNVQNNCENILGFKISDLIGQNCSILSPNSISNCHNNLMKEGIEKGLLNFYGKKVPLITKNKEGFGQRVSLQFQMNSLKEQEEIGLICRIAQYKMKSELFILADIQNGSCKIESVSEELFQQLLNKFFLYPLSVEGIQLHKLLPCLTNISKLAKEMKISKFKYESLMYLPNIQMKSEQRKKMFFDSSQDYLRNIEQNYYQVQICQIFLVSLTVKILLHKGKYELIFVKFKSIKLLQTGSEYLQYLKSNYLIHLSNLQILDQNDFSSALSILMKDGDINYHFIPLNQCQISIQSSRKIISKANFNQSMNESYLNLQNCQIITTSERDFHLDLEQSEDNHSFSEKMINYQNVTKMHLSTKKTSLTKDFRIKTSKKQAGDPIKQQLSFESNQLNHKSSRKNPNNIQAENQQQKVNQNKLEVQKENGSQNNNINKTQSNYKNKNIDLLTLEGVLYSQKVNEKQLFDITEMILPAKNSENFQQFIGKLSPQNNLHTADRLLSPMCDNNFNQKVGKIIKRIHVSEQKKNNNLLLQDKQDQASYQSVANLSNSIRYILDRKITEQKQSFALKILLSYIIFFSVGMLIIVSVSYIFLYFQLSNQQLNSNFSWWQDKIVGFTLLTILRLNEKRNIIQLNLFQFCSEPDEQLFINSIPNIILYSYRSFLDQVKRILAEDQAKLEVLYNLNQMQQGYHYYSVINISNTTRQLSFLNSLVMYEYNAFTLTQKSIGYSKISEYELIYNSLAIQERLNTLSDFQEQLSEQQNLDIKDSVERSLIIIVTLSILITLVIFYFYYFFQKKKEFVLSLFSSIEPQHIRQINKKLQESQFILARQIKKNDIKQADKINKIVNSDSINIRKNVLINLNTEDSKIGMSSIRKKKKNIPTIPLRKFSKKLFFKICLIIFIINAQPITNLILTSNQIIKSKNQQSIVKGLYSIIFYIQDTEWMCLSYTTTLFSPKSKLIPFQIYANQLPWMLSSLDKSFDKLFSLINDLTSSSNYSESEMGIFFNTIFSGNLCQGLLTYSRYVQNLFNYSECINLYGGILTQGYISGIKKYQNLIRQFQQISYLSDLKEKKVQVSLFYEKNDFLILENFFQIIVTASEAIIMRVSEEKQQYFDTIFQTQFYLFWFEIIILIIIFPTLLFPFFKETKNDILTTIQTLSILQLHDLLSSTYIINYLKMK